MSTQRKIDLVMNAMYNLLLAVLLSVFADSVFRGRLQLLPSGERTAQTIENAPDPFCSAVFFPVSVVP
ncbi:hypothetical protein LKD70_05155 [Ruminococcus sp. CLA-AA-H200]|uniref:Uncharacterized protein n=1 Tax=Ruminococcus turbiniformis TaxID=2881258 RepID=A0ABS8FUU0_9FIRM|nr:hypothetical protein [Ruminococcus turbiniformis]MCC2253826.1 hypothetical protein [Ruminococcus turbiniformis]